MEYLNKFRKVFFIAIIMLCICPTDSYGQTITNSGFEENTVNWIKTNNDVLFSILDSDPKEGSQSASISNSSSSSYGVEQIIADIQPETTYKISAFTKTYNPSQSKSFIRVAWYSSADGSGSQMKTVDSEEITNTDWQEVMLRVTSPKEAHSAKIRLLVSSGTALFDEISIQKYIEILATPTIVPTQQPSLTIQSTAPPISRIFISEVMVYPPSGESEWIEIYNQNDQTVILSDWYIDDAENEGASAKQFSIELPSNGFKIYELTSSIFNNAGDQVRILNESREVVDSFLYSDSQQGYTLGKTTNDSFCDQIASPNNPNNDCFSQPISIIPTNNFPTITPSILGSFDKQNTPTPLKRRMNPVKSHILVAPTMRLADTSPRLVEIPIDESNRIDKDPWLLLSGSYSFLAFISLVSKTFIFRYT